MAGNLGRKLAEDLHFKIELLRAHLQNIESLEGLCWKLKNQRPQKGIYSIGTY